MAIPGLIEGSTPAVRALLGELMDLLEAVEDYGDRVEDLLSMYPEAAPLFENRSYQEVEHAAYAARAALRRAGA